MDYLCIHKTTGLVGSQLYPGPLRSSKLKHPNSLLRDASLTCFLIPPVIMRYLNVSQHFCIHSWRAFAVSDLSFCLMQRKPIVSLPPILDKKNRLVPASQQPLRPPSVSHLGIRSVSTFRPEMPGALIVFTGPPSNYSSQNVTPWTGHSISHEALLMQSRREEELDASCMLESYLYTSAWCLAFSVYLQFAKNIRILFLVRHAGSPSQVLLLCKCIERSCYAIV